MATTSMINHVKETRRRHFEDKDWLSLSPFLFFFWLKADIFIDGLLMAATARQRKERVMKAKSHASSEQSNRGDDLRERERGENLQVFVNPLNTHTFSWESRSSL